MNTYIHYGSETFNPEKLTEQALSETRDSWLSQYKPCGLWGSPEDSRYAWKEWCTSEDFHTERLKTSFRFSLDKTARVLRIHSMEDAIPYLVRNKAYDALSINAYTLDTERIESEFDAMEVIMDSDLYWNNVFRMWDVDSVCVWNPEVVEVIR